VNDNRDAGRQPAELAFAVAGTVTAGAFALLLPFQAAWRPGWDLAAQPGLWPALGIGMMLVCGVCWIAGLWREVRADGAPPGGWLVAAEYMLWFLAYGWLVPLAGYLIATVIALPLLAHRAGYRGWRPTVVAIATALGLALVFQFALSVALPASPMTRIVHGLPGGANLWRY
jgi:hypothetical protein